jgi:putative MFS transporter
LPHSLVSQNMNKLQKSNPFNIIVVVSALGYFVDIYDLILFSVVRKSSLEYMGFSGAELLEKGVYLLNWQMAGMLLGGILWGILGDKKGRVSVLFGSILMYSLANFANGFVSDIDTYALLRFIAGIGLAGELGAGITLVSETMTRENRGYGTMLVVSFGVMGAILAAFIGNNFEWQTAYFIGGALGLLLLFLRIGVYESNMFDEIKKSNLSRGNFFKLFTSYRRFFRYLCCILIGLPIWFVIGILIIFSPEFAEKMGVNEPINAGTSVMYCYLGLGIGDFLSGYLSQIFKSRKKIVFACLILTGIAVSIFLMQKSPSEDTIYLMCFILGVAAGYWAIFITIASEQFGTDIRSTVTTTVPNFVRGAVIPLTLSFNYLKNQFGTIEGAVIVGLVSILLAFFALAGLKETYGLDLNYHEDDAEKAGIS